MFLGPIGWTAMENRIASAWSSSPCVSIESSELYLNPKANKFTSHNQVLLHLLISRLTLLPNPFTSENLELDEGT